MNLAFGRGYCDLNIPYNAENVESMVQKAVDLGYQTVAINVKVHQKNLMTKSKQQYLSRKSELKENLMLDFPAPPEINAREGITILFRLTIKFTNNDFLPFFVNSETVKKYDLLALHPESTLAIQNLLKNGFKAEIICFDPNNVKDVMWSRKLYMECVNRDMFFEIPYSPCIRDQFIRRRIIAQAHNYHAVGKSKAIIFTSEALKPLELRGPIDVASLAYVMGLNEQQGHNAVMKNPLKVVENAAGRKLGPYRALVQLKEDLTDSWNVPSDISISDSEEVPMD